MDGHDLHGNAALITGGSTEIAGAVALALARAGVSICLCGRDASLLDLAAGRVRASGGTCLTIVSELDGPEEVASVVDFACAGLGALDILVLVSPFWAGGEIHAHSVRTWDLVLDANLREPFLMARAILPLFRTRKQGQILAIGSDSALGIYKQDGAYGVAMHALTALMGLIRLENEELGIRTHILAPGVALTTETDSEGRPALTAAHVADWAVWQLTRPGHLRGSGLVRIQPR